MSLQVCPIVPDHSSGTLPSGNAGLLWGSTSRPSWLNWHQWYSLQWGLMKAMEQGQTLPGQGPPAALTKDYVSVFLKLVTYWQDVRGGWAMESAQTGKDGTTSGSCQIIGPIEHFLPLDFLLCWPLPRWTLCLDIMKLWLLPSVVRSGGTAVTITRTFLAFGSGLCQQLELHLSMRRCLG